LRLVGAPYARRSGSQRLDLHLIRRPLGVPGKVGDVRVHALGRRVDVDAEGRPFDDLHLFLPNERSSGPDYRRSGKRGIDQLQLRPGAEALEPGAEATPFTGLGEI